MFEGRETEAGERDFAELERRRDKCLLRIQYVLAEDWFPHGEDGWPEPE